MNEQNTGQVNEPGTYRDPESGAQATVAMAAGADALVHLGWKPVTQDTKEKPKVTRLPENL